MRSHELQFPDIRYVSPDEQVVLEKLNLSHVSEVFSLIDRSRLFLDASGEPISRMYRDEQDVRDSIMYPLQRSYSRFVVRDAVCKVIVGCISFFPHYLYADMGEIGYWLGNEHVGKGYMTRAVQTVTEYAFSKQEYNVIEARVRDTNNASAKVLVRAGYEYYQEELYGETTMLRYRRLRENT